MISIMPETRVVQFVVQCLVSITACFIFTAIGSILLALVEDKSDPKDREGSLCNFYALFHGITFSVCLYAVIRTGGITVHLLILAAYFWWLAGSARSWKRLTVMSFFPGAFARWREIVLGCLLFTAIFHFLPESEYKQNDS